MFFLTFPNLYKNCTIFPIARDPAPFPMNWKKTLPARLSLEMNENIP